MRQQTAWVGRAAVAAGRVLEGRARPLGTHGRWGERERAWPPARTVAALGAVQSFFFFHFFFASSASSTLRTVDRLQE
ncbi:hypothetical protein ACOSQ3_013257 [Xanthoceras sorbifolium]